MNAIDALEMVAAFIITAIFIAFIGSLIGVF